MLNHPLVRMLTILFLMGSALTLNSCKWKWGHIGYNTGYSPEQPLPFSHKLHAGQYQVSCLYCHSTVEASEHSPVPSLNVCMNCHLVVGTDKEPIKKLQEKFFAGDTINWVKVHMLPDHVKFNHKRHVHRFSEPSDRYQACQKCHGDVKNMERIEQVNSLGMGWCVNCHRESSPQGNLNCSTCHH